jgi:hypothetical protein
VCGREFKRWKPKGRQLLAAEINEQALREFNGPNIPSEASEASEAIPPLGDKEEPQRVDIHEIEAIKQQQQAATQALKKLLGDTDD